jgi:dihydroxyacetone kinase-like protein
MIDTLHYSEEEDIIMADVNKVIEIIKKISVDIEDQKDFLTELDNVIADGDHGINMARGFQTVEEIIPTFYDKDIGNILKQVGMKLLATVGGASGPLYGTAFMKAGAAVNGKKEIDMNDFMAMFKAAIEGVQKRGKATTGEKTMLDSMIPAYEAIKTSYEADQDKAKAFAAGVKAAEDGIEYTKTIIATKGRASYIGERSIGHQDPGATSFTIMLKDIAELV